MSGATDVIATRSFRRRLVRWLVESGVVPFTSGFLAGAVWWYIWGIRRGYFPIYFGPSSKRWERAGWNEAEQQLLRTWESSGGRLETRKPSDRNFLGGFNQPRRVTYQWVWFESEKCVRGLVRYGTDTEGPPRCVHGGCTATVVDALMGYVAWASTKKWIVTRNLDVNYRKFVPIGSTVQVHAWFDKEDGRKVFCKFEVWSFDRNVLHNEGSALFIDSQAKRVTTDAIVNSDSQNVSETARPMEKDDAGNEEKDIEPSGAQAKWSQVRKSVRMGSVLSSHLNDIRGKALEKAYEDEDWTQTRALEAPNDGEVS